MIGGAFLALEGVQVEVLGQVAGDAGVAVPEGRLVRADAGPRLGVVDSVGWAVDAGIGLGVVVLVGLAGHALFAIVERVGAGAAGAGSGLEVVDLALGAGEAEFLDEVEVVGHEAGDAGVVVPEVVVLALAGVLGVAEGLSKWAGLAVVGGGVVEGRSGAGGAGISVEEGSSCGAILALLEGGIVDLLVVAEEAEILAEVEVLGRVAFYAVAPVPVEPSGALAGLIKHDHAALAGLAVAAVRVPHRPLGADIALLAIEIGSLLGTVHALLLHDAVDLIVRADLADLIGEVEVVGMVALDADGAVEEKRIVFALAGVRVGLVDSAGAAGLAGKGSVVVEGPLLADCAFLAVEEGLVLGAEDALVQVEVVDCVLGAGGADLALKVEVFGEVALDALDLGEEGLVGWAFADVPFFDVVAAAAAFLAALDGDVEVEPSGAGLAAIGGEDGLVSGAAHAGLQVRVVEMVLLAGLADLVLVVEVLGQVAADAGLVVLEGPSRWADAALQRGVVLLALLAVRARLGGIVEVLGRVAGDALGIADLVRALRLALAAARGHIVASPLEAVLTGLGRGVPELVARTQAALAAVEEGEVGRAGLAFLGVEVVGLSIGALATL